MQRFHTHVSYDNEYAQDVEGERFDDLEAACECARQSARRLVAQLIGAGHNLIRLEYRIHDEAGAHLATVPVHATVSGLG